MEQHIKLLCGSDDMKKGSIFQIGKDISPARTGALLHAGKAIITKIISRKSSKK